MRENKFQAYDSLNNKIISWNDLGHMEMNGEISIHTLISGEYEHLKPLQHTGLQDSKGKDIYDRGIMKITFDTNYSDKSYYIGVVKYGSERDYPAFDLVPWIDCEMNALCWLKSESDESVISYEIIGNIDENPEMLEVVIT